MQENREQGTETFVPDVRLTRFMFLTDARTDR